MTLKKTVLLLSLLIATLATKAQTAEEVISKYIQFIGGEVRWGKIRTIVSSGTYNYGGMEFPFQSFSKRPARYKFIVPFKGKYFAQAYDGKQGWKIDAFNNETKKTLLTGMPALAMANEADVELESPFIHYQAKGHRIEPDGTDTVNGSRCFKVKLIRKNGETENYCFSSIDYALVKKVATSKNSELKNSLLTTFYTDYRSTQGIKIPFIATSKSDDQTILTITLIKVELNVPLPDAEFAF